MAFRWTQTHGRLGIGALLVIGGVCWTLGNLWGLVAWGTIILAWFLFPPVVAVGLGQFSLLGIASGFVPLLVGETALGLLLVAEWAESDGLSGAIYFVGGSMLAVVLVLGLLQWQGVVAALAGVVVSIGLVSYELHRYLLRRLGVLYDREHKTAP